MCRSGVTAHGHNHNHNHNHGGGHGENCGDGGLDRRKGGYSKCSSPKKPGSWKLGFGVSIGLHDRKWGRGSLSPHL